MQKDVRRTKDMEEDVRGTKDMQEEVREQRICKRMFGGLRNAIGCPV
jgi:hypothetical protein